MLREGSGNCWFIRVTWLISLFFRTLCWSSTKVFLLTDSSSHYLGTGKPHFVQCIRKVAVHLGYSTYVSKLLLKCAVVSLYSVVKQRLRCNIGKVCNCLIQFLLTVVLSIEKRVFLVEYVFPEGNRYTGFYSIRLLCLGSSKICSVSWSPTHV
jgi:hypothetical protein